VEKIDELFSLIEAGEQALAKARKLLEGYRQSVLNAAVTGELTKDWRERHQGEIESGEGLLKRILKARRKAWEKAELAKMHARGKPPTNDRWKQKYKSPQSPDTSNLPEVPKGWAWASLEMLTDIVGGITVDAKRTGPDLQEVPYLRVANVQRGRLELSEVKMLLAAPSKIKELRLAPGDILLNEGGDRDKIGRGWIWEGQLECCIHQNHVFKARLYVFDLPPKYVSYYANEMGRNYFFSEGKQTTNLASINLTKVSLLPIPIPSAAEAFQVVELLDEACSLVDHAISDSGVQRVQADRLRQSILAAAFSGKLVPQDPADEPASILLERIREERPGSVRTTGRKMAGRRGRTTKRTETAMTVTRKEVKSTHLRDILRAGHGSMEAGALWKVSDLDIDDFYKQLRDEIAAGHLREDREGQSSQIICR
jgi:type I restriction enzyme S subunit